MVESLSMCNASKPAWEIVAQISVLYQEQGKVKIILKLISVQTQTAHTVVTVQVALCNRLFDQTILEN